MSLSRRALLAVVGCAACVVACLSPTLPLPPPGEPQAERVGQGRYLLSGSVQGPGWVTALNDRTHRIAGQSTDVSGGYAFEVEARPDDPMRLWFSVDGELSQPLEFVIEDLLAPVSPNEAGAPAGDASDGAP